MNWKKILGLLAVGVVAAAGAGYLWHELGQKSDQKEKPDNYKIQEKYGLVFRYPPLPSGVEEGEFPENIFSLALAQDALTTDAGFDNVEKVYGGTLENLGEWADKISKKAGEEDFAFIMLDPGHGGQDITDLGSYDDINKALEPLDKENIPTGIVIDTCYSGSGIDELEADRRFIMTSTSDNQTDEALTDLIPYMARAYEPWEFTHSLDENFPTPFIYSLGADVHPKDNKLTALELFKFAEYNIRKFDKERKEILPAVTVRDPQLWDPENLAGRIDMGEAVPYQGENLGSRYKGENK